MWRYILKRLILMIPIIIGVTILIFTIMYFVPGDPTSTILGQNATAEEMAAKRIELGLDQPYLIRLWDYCKRLFFHFDFGTSYITGRSIGMELLSRLPRTMGMCAACIIIAMCVGIPLGVNAAIHHGGFWDNFSMILALIGVSMPVFWVAMLLVLLFSLKLGWLPSVGYTSIQHYILPCIANSLSSLAIQARQTRSGMLEVIRSDYITTARAKGLPERKVIFRHALPNALIPVLTIACTNFGKMLGATVVIETIFTIPGIGGFMINGVTGRDYPVVMGSVIFLAILFSLIMLLVDLLYAVIDPRIKAQYAKRAVKSK
ncbi:MAG: ABC transporter permease [Lachnospiraceae bacterium]|jgi:ABC-type dipeptide/oligopeptide/nickel transport system permease component